MDLCRKLPLGCLVALALVCVSAAAAARAQRQQTGDQKIGPEGARAIGEAAREKRARTATQRKIDTQLWYALKQRRGETRGVPTEPVDVKLDPQGRTLVDITAKVSAALVSKLERAGAEVLSKSARYHTVRARLALEKLEAVAGIEEVRYISPVARPATHGGARTN